MKIKKYITLLAIIVALLTLGNADPIQIVTDLQSSIKTINDKPHLDLHSKNQEVKRFLQSVPVTTGTGATLNWISNTKYNGVTLYHDIPLNWIIGQIFLVKGRLNIPAVSNGTYVSFSFINSENSTSKFWFSAIVPSGSTDFTLKVDTRQIPYGDYYLALYSGLSGSYYSNPVYQFRYADAQPSAITPPSTPTGCSLNFEENMLILRWNEDGITPLEKITFTQGTNVIQYTLSNFQSSFIIQHKDFVNFSPGYVTVRIASAFSSLITLEGRLSQFSAIPWSYVFKAGYHSFNQFKGGISLGTQIPWRVPIGSNIRIQGWTSVSINNLIQVQQPQQFVGQYKLTSTSNNIIPPGTAFDTILSLPRQGIYILQINIDSGQAAINRPIYVGDSFPLLPDLIDLTDPNKDISQIVSEQPQDIYSLRNLLLSLINKKRQQWSLSPLTLDNTLNNLAQSHSNDMINRNFFGHINPNGDGPLQRANKAQIFGGIGQNVAYNLDLKQANYRLLRSPGHLRNIVNQNYTTVGLGISRNTDGYLYVTENFLAPAQSNTQGSGSYSSQISTIVTSNQIQNLRHQVSDWIAQSYPTSHEDATLSKIVISWISSNSTDSIFNYTWYTSHYQSNALSSSSVTGPYSTTLTSYLVVGTHLKPIDSTYGKFGVGIGLQSDGQVKVVVQFAV